MKERGANTFCAPMYEQIKEIWREVAFFDHLEGAMTTLLVPWERIAVMEPHVGSLYSASRHHLMLRRLGEIFGPLIGKQVAATGQVALPTVDGWREYWGDWGQPFIRGRVTGVDGFVMTYERHDHYRYCLVFDDAEVTADDPPIDRKPHQTGNRRALLPIRGMDGRWWHKICEIDFEETSDD